MHMVSSEISTSLTLVRMLINEQSISLMEPRSQKATIRLLPPQGTRAILMKTYSRNMNIRMEGSGRRTRVRR